MPKFKVEIEEISQRVEEIEAENIEEALDLVEEKYDNNEIELDYNDFKGHEVREYKSKVNEEDLIKDTIINISSGQAMLLEGDKNVGLIKKLGVSDFAYVVATGIIVNKYETGFEWNQGSYHQNIIEATEKFKELSGYMQHFNSLIYSELGKTTLENNNVGKFENIDEIFRFLIDEDINKEELIDLLSDIAKEEVVSRFADSVVEEDGKYYYGNDICFFEDDINEKTRKIDTILNQLRIKDIKPYDVIELLEQDFSECIDIKLQTNIENAIKAAGYEKSINDFINYINEELSNEEEEVEENEM